MPWREEHRKWGKQKLAKPHARFDEGGQARACSLLYPSERFVTDLCRRSFLKLWTHPNPKGKKGKELCDCLVVCGPHIVIISVKESEYKDTGNTTGWERWAKATIEKSASQIWSAERWLDAVDEVIRRTVSGLDIIHHRSPMITQLTVE